MYQFKHRSNLIILAFVMLTLSVLVPGCTINIYFMNSEPSSTGEDQASAARQAPELPLIHAQEDEQGSSVVPTPAPPQAAESKYVGSVNSNRYHYPDCEWAQKISPANQVWFTSAEEAQSRGYLPCKVCKPPAQ